MNQAEMLREYAARWKRVGPQLEEIRLRELRGLITSDVVKHLEPAFDLASRLPPRSESGLVEQQRIFRKLHRRK